MLHIAHEEGLLSNNSNMHLGSRCALFDEHFDLNNDLRCGFTMVRARELDILGVDKVVQKIVDRVGDNYVYLSVDIDVLDPAFAPATGTIEPGGWTTREVSFLCSLGAEFTDYSGSSWQSLMVSQTQDSKSSEATSLSLRRCTIMQLRRLELLLVRLCMRSCSGWFTFLSRHRGHNRGCIRYTKCSLGIGFIKNLDHYRR